MITSASKISELDEDLKRILDKLEQAGIEGPV
jgi:hypothetical protein